MKKTILIFICVLIFSRLFSSSWDGGYARMQSLGGIQQAIDDRTGNAGLFNAGFGSAILLNNPGNTVTLTPLLSFAYWGYPGKIWYELKSLDCFMENANMINVNLTGDDNIMIKPYYNNSTVQDGSFTATDRETGAEVQYARRITGEIGAGATIRYTYLRQETDPLKISSNRLEWLVDAYYKDTEGLTAAVSAGFMGALFKNRAYTENFFTYIGNYETFNYSLDGFSGKLENVFMDIELKNSWINLGAGLEYEKIGEVKAYAAGGALINAASESKFINHSFHTDVTSTDRGSGYYADMGVRAYLPALIVVSASAKGRRIDYTGTDDSLTPEGSQYSRYNGTMTLGAAYDSAMIKVPAEFYMNVNDKYETSGLIRFGGVRGGVEYNMSEMLSIRLGADWPGLHDLPKGRVSAGEYAVTGGIGLNYAGLKVNAGCRYYSLREKRTYPYIYGTYELNLTRVMADITYNF